jgi:predicted nucleic acid-binding Zn ribbon protein
MPTYVYRILRPGKPTETFEVQQSILASPLTHHPETGEPVERVICPPTIASGKLGDADIRNAGLTKYTRTSDGTYEKH